MSAGYHPALTKSQLLAAHSLRELGLSITEICTKLGTTRGSTFRALKNVGAYACVKINTSDKLSKTLVLPTYARVLELLSYDLETGIFTWVKPRRSNQIKAGDEACYTSKKSKYAVITFDGVPILAHRLAWFYVNQHWPADSIDHINGVRSDNRFCNLREATPMENNNGFRARSKANTSGYTGVHFHKQRGRWVAKVQIFGRLLNLGLHDTPEQANTAILKAREQYGSFRVQG